MPIPARRRGASASSADRRRAGAGSSCRIRMTSSRRPPGCRRTRGRLRGRARTFLPRRARDHGRRRSPVHRRSAARARPSRVPLGEAIRLRFSKWAPFHRRNLANSLGRECLAHPGISVFTHANAIALEQTGRRIRSVAVRNYAGSDFQFFAEQIVVCLGTIESSRLLLASPMPDGSSVGNGHDQVGRYFHDHVSLRRRGPRRRGARANARTPRAVLRREHAAYVQAGKLR